MAHRDPFERLLAAQAELGGLTPRTAYVVDTGQARLRKAPKRHFVDPSLALAANGASAERLLEDIQWFGQLFESLVIRDLRVLSRPLDGEVLHYRDDYGVEVDAIMHLHDGRWGAIEIKLGESQVDAAAAGLKRFSDQIDPQRSGSPANFAVI
jgi:predicted AAA+ superfamily ATPase